MKHVGRLNISMGKSTIVIYNSNRRCEYEGDLHHTSPAFESFKEILDQLKVQDEQAPEIILKQLDFIVHR
ncbi:hypothetical protein HOO54_05720 [Bacillus sp. WMMC1349]|uniref:hypothetical protein n=1 Tax=Bacillus sp. WMMC1349 TaxID=2736254 RepID=UPI001555BD16|nr:hypothetical protein [Bacillus sp. WMMC1349]NPC91743.1 hypothetical protein [Bacillus sp. WMMC1349]